MSKSTNLPPYLADMQKEIEGYAKGYGLDFFQTVFEVLDYKTMNEVAAYGGFPMRYPHWRYGMDYEQLSKSYEYGLSKIYEMVINNDPCYAYLLEGNSTVDQKMVMAHVFGHCDFFKNNFYFSKTNRKMIDGMANHATRVRQHIERHGIDKVESFIDTCLSLDNLIDPYLPFSGKRASRSARDPGGRQDRRARRRCRVSGPSEYMDKFINPPEFMEKQRKKIEKEKERVREVPGAPGAGRAALPARERAARAVGARHPGDRARGGLLLRAAGADQDHERGLGQLLALEDHDGEGGSRTSEIIDYADHHSGTMATAPGQLNPYKLGIELYRDIEDRWNKGRFGKEWDECDDLRWPSARLGQEAAARGAKKIFEVRKLYNDVTFIDEFLTAEFADGAEVLFVSGSTSEAATWEIVDREFRKVKDKLLQQLTNFGQPIIDVRGRQLREPQRAAAAHRHEGVDLQMDHAKDTLQNLCRVWKRPVCLLTRVEGKGKLLRFDGRDHTEKSHEVA